MKERLDYIDKAKGILITLVVIGHIWQSGFLFDLIYTFHMPAFFVISGILLAHTRGYERNFGAFLRKHIYAYGIPFLFFEVLGVMVQIMRHGVTLNWKGYLFTTVTLALNAPQCWFLVALFLIEILVVAAIKTIRKPAIICMISGALFLVRSMVPAEIMYVGTLVSAWKYLPFFLAGFYGNKFWSRNHPAAVVVCAAGVLICTFFGGKAQSSALKDADLLIGGFCGTYLTICLACRSFTGKAEALLKAAGTNSLIIYGTHYPYYAALGILVGVRDFASTPLGIGLVILGGVAILEIPTIYIINRWLPFLAGKRRRRSVTA